MSFVRIPPETITDILKRIAAGDIRADIARACGVSEYSVTMIARRANVEVVKCPIGSRWGKLDKIQAQNKTAADPAADWRAKAWASRRFAGNGYVK